MKKYSVLVILFMIIISACTSQAEPTAKAPAATEAGSPAAMPTEPATSPTEPLVVEPTTADLVTDPANPPEQPEAPAGLTMYKIVPGESSVTYEVGETFFNDNNRFAVAIGRTPQISGEIAVDTVNPQNSQVGPIEIDISQFKSDSTRRDGVIRDRFLESGKYPIATFTPTKVEGLPTSYSPGEELSFTITGDLTVRTTTQPITFDVTARIEEDVLVGTATTTITMSQFGVGPITIAGILGTEDEVKLSFSFIAKP